MMFQRILVATHGTEGARAAEAYALELARDSGAEVHALYVIHKGWGSLVGIEWLHSSEKRMEFYRYAESELFRRAEEVLGAARRAAADIYVTPHTRVGEPTEIIAETAEELGVDLIVLGPSGGARSEEYQARVRLKKLLGRAPCPVLIAPRRQRPKAPRGQEAALAAHGES